MKIIGSLTTQLPMGKAGRRILLRIPMKKIAHSELMTIRSSPSGAGKCIVKQLIVMGQEKVRS